MHCNLVLLAGAAGLLTLVQSSQAVPFSATTVDGSMTGDVKAIADIDGDGYPDVVVGGDPTAKMYWYRYPTWTKRLVATPAVEFTTDMQAGDVDGDGDQDLIVPDGSGANNVRWFRNPAPAVNPTNAGVWTAVSIGTQGGYAHDVEVGDVNNDGRLDVVTRTASGPLILWLQNSPSNWAGRNLTAAAGLPAGEGLALDDVDGDGDLDIAAAGYWVETPADLADGVFSAHAIDSVPSETAHLLADLNRDGRPDLVTCPLHNRGTLAWYAAPVNVHTGAWVKHTIDTSSGSHKLSAADFNRDGWLDLALGLEGQEVSIWTNSGGPVPTFSRQVVSGSPGAHNLRVGDIDADGDMDLFGAGYIGTPPPATVWRNTSPAASNVPPAVTLRQPAPAAVFQAGARVVCTAFAQDGDGSVRRVEFYANAVKIGEDNQRPFVCRWQTATAETVELTARAVDNAGATTTSTPVTVHVRQDRLPLDRWTYLRADSSRDRATFGLAFGDVTGDGFQDIVSGRYFYRNPGGPMTSAWVRVTLPGTTTLDANLTVDVDGDGRPDVMAQDLPTVYWLRPVSAMATAWTAVAIGTLAATEHQNSQGYRTAQIVPGGKPEIVYTAGYPGAGTAGLYYFVIPSNPAAGNWPKVRITADPVSEDGLAAGDIDRDGDDDVVAAYSGTGDRLAWWENPGSGAPNWVRHDLGDTPGGWCDRISLADLNGDGRLDVTASVENGAADGAATYWFEQPLVPTNAAWTRRTIALQGSTNSKDVGDMDGDGDPDVVTGEHRGQLRVTIWENQTNASAWAGTVIASNRESHLGARIVDLDGDGDLDVVSIAYDAYGDLHVWRNDAVGTGVTATVPTLSVEPLALAALAWVSNDAPAGAFAVWNSGTGVVHYTVEPTVPWLAVAPVSGATTGEHDTIAVQFLAAGLATGTYSGSIAVTATNPGVAGATQTVAVVLTVTRPVVATPSILPPGAVFADAIPVSLTCATPGAVIRYTLDGSDPASDAPVYAGPFTVSNSVTVKARGFFDGAEASAVAAAVFTRAGIAAYWPLDEGAGSVAADLSGNGHTGAVNGAVWAPGRTGAALQFDGLDDRVEVGPFDVAGTGLTLMVWVRADSLVGDVRLLSKATGIMEQDHYWMLSSYDDGDRLRFRLKAGGSTSTLIADQQSLGTGVWTHVAAVYDGAAMILYQDGIEVGRAAKSGAIASNGAVAVWIGANPPNNGSSPFHGRLDEVRVYAAALSSTQIQSIMTDADADGLPDDWELRYAAGLGVLHGSGDADGDRFPDGHEYRAGTDPTNSLSLLALTALDLSPTGVVLHWPSVDGRRYRIDRAFTLEPASFTSLFTNLPATVPANRCTDPTALLLPAAFYRVLVE